MDSNLTASDIALMSRDGADFGGNSFFWVFALLLLAGGNLGFGMNRNGDFSQFATAASQNEILSGQKFDTISRQINAVGDGISSLGYSQLQQMNNNTAAINANITNEGRALQTQIAECCCSTKEAIHAEGEATRALLQQNKIEALQAQINQLQLQNSLGNVVRYPTASTWAMSGNPFCGCNCCG